MKYDEIRSLHNELWAKITDSDINIYEYIHIQDIWVKHIIT